MSSIHPYTSHVAILVVTAILCGVPQAFAAAAPGPITAERAEAIALGRVPGGTVRECERDRDDGRDVFEVEVRDPSGRDHDIVIEASSGRIVSETLDDD